MKKIRTERKPQGATHTISYKMGNGYAHQQNAYGKTDLIATLRTMMKDGYTSFEIKTIKKAD